MEKQLIFGVAVLLICVGLSGCNEPAITAGDDDEEFIDVYLYVYTSMNNVKISNLEDRHNNAATYRTDIGHYELSDECESIRSSFLLAFGRIDNAYEWATSDYPNLELAQLDIDMANSYFESAADKIIEWDNNH